MAKELVLSDPAFVTAITVTWSCFLPQKPMPHLPPYTSSHVFVHVPECHNQGHTSAFYCLVHPCLIAPSNSKRYFMHMNSEVLSTGLRGHKCVAASELRAALPSEAVSAFFFFEMSFLSLEVQLAYYVLAFQILF